MSVKKYILVTFSSKDVVVLIWTSRFNGNFQVFISHFNLLSLALLASVLLLHLLSVSFAVQAFGLSLSVHTWTQLSQFGHHSSSFAFSTFCNILASLSITTFTSSSSNY